MYTWIIDKYIARPGFLLQYFYRQRFAIYIIIVPIEIERYHQLLNRTTDVTFWGSASGQIVGNLRARTRSVFISALKRYENNRARSANRIDVSRPKMANYYDYYYVVAPINRSCISLTNVDGVLYTSGAVRGTNGNKSRKNAKTPKTKNKKTNKTK